jgi:hypothetical protein
MLHEPIGTGTPARPLRHWALGLLASALLLTGCESQADRDQKAADAAYREKLAKAKAIFAERCKTAGVVIHRTVKDVEGIELTKVRPQLEWADKRYFDPMFEGAAMAGENKGDNYINQFLMTESFHEKGQMKRGMLNSPKFDAGTDVVSKRGYRFVEVLELQSGQRLRAELGDYPPNTNLWVRPPRKTPISKSATRYALDYEDIVNPSDRQHWVAGTILKVVDKQTGEVIATFTKFVWDPGFGVSTTGRLPWSHAGASSDRKCPPTPRTPTGFDSRYFVDTVLIPKQGN